MKNIRISTIVCAVLVMTVLLSFAGCGCSRAEAEPTAVPTGAPTEAPTAAPTEAPTEPAPTEPEWQPGLARATHTEALHTLLNKGDEVEVVGKFEHYFIISSEPYDLLVDEYYVRLSSEDAFESWTGYSRHNRPVFDSVYMRNEPIARLATNTKLTILEAKGDWVYVEWKDGKGYMKEEDVSKYRLTNGGGSGSSGGAPVDGTDVDVGSLSATTGGHNGIVTLGAYYGPEMEADFEKGKGIVLAEEIEAYITAFDFGEEMKVVEYDEEFCTIYLDTDLTARVRRDLVKLEGDTEEEPWIGYSRSNAVVFEEYQRRDEWGKLKLNTEVQVLYQLPGMSYLDEGVYAVSIDGEILYMQIDSVSKTKIRPAAGGGGSSSSGSSDVWTPPAL